MLWFKIVFLLCLFVGGLFCGWQSFLLLTGRNLRAIASYKGATPEQASSLARHHGLLFFVVASWLVLLPVLILVLQVRFSAWGPLTLTTAGILVVGKRLIERKHGLKHS